MTIEYLDNHLPIEISDIVYKYLHRSIMREVCEIITHKIVFILVDDRLSFLVCEGQKWENYNSVLYE